MKSLTIKNLLKASKLALSLLDEIARNDLSLDNTSKEIIDFLARAIHNAEVK